MIILEDADMDAAVSAAGFGAFMNQGQICMSTERIVVEKPIAESFAQKLAAKANSLKMGDPKDPTTQIGCVINKNTLDRAQKWWPTRFRKALKFFAEDVLTALPTCQPFFTA